MLWRILHIKITFLLLIFLTLSCSSNDKKNDILDRPELPTEQKKVEKALFPKHKLSFEKEQDSLRN